MPANTKQIAFFGNGLRDQNLPNVAQLTLARTCLATLAAPKFVDNLFAPLRQQRRGRVLVWLDFAPGQLLAELHQISG